MKRNLYSILCLLLMALITGCSGLFSKTSEDQESPSLNPANAPTTIPLTMKMLENAEYPAQNGTMLVNLVEGRYETGSGTDKLSVSLHSEVAFGDLNSDDIQDAAIILVENYGGSGNFEYLTPVFNRDGAPLPSSGYFLGDRVVVNSINIEDGRIMLDMMVHAPNDPLCCPTLPMTQSIKFYWGPGLLPVRVSSGTPDGGIREINIETPREGEEVTSKIQLSGNVSIAPFENTLMVRILDANNIPIFQGPIMVSSQEMGAPGSFDVVVDISDSPVSPGMLRIEILDLSMADGSTLAMDSVDVMLK